MHTSYLMPLIEIAFATQKIQKLLAIVGQKKLAGETHFFEITSLR